MNTKVRDIFSSVQRLWRERRPVVVACIVLVLGLPVVVLLAQLNNRETAAPVVTKAIDQFREDTSKGDYDKAYEKLKAQQSQAATKEQKVQLYDALAAAAANAGKTEEAIGYLEQKHELDSTSIPADAFMLARLYEQAGNKADALAQYKLALNYYKQQQQGDSLTAQSMVGSIEATIADLEAQDE